MSFRFSFFYLIDLTNFNIILTNDMIWYVLKIFLFDLKNTKDLQQDFLCCRFLDIGCEISHEDKEYPNRKINIYLSVSGRNPNETTPDYELFDSLFLSITVIDWNTAPDFMDKRSTSGRC